MDGWNIYEVMKRGRRVSRNDGDVQLLYSRKFMNQEFNI